MLGKINISPFSGGKFFQNPLIYVLAFALTASLGTMVIFAQSNPSSQTYDFSGRLNKKNNSASYSIEAVDGPVTATLTYERNQSETLVLSLQQGGTIVHSTSGTSPVVLSADVTAGQYDIVVDRNSNESSTLKFDLSVTVGVIDEESPSVTITSPSEGDTISGVATIQGNASDNVAITEVTLDVDGTNPTVIASSAGDWQHQLDSTILADGSHVISVTATDASSNNTTSWLEIISDNSQTGDPDPVLLFDANPESGEQAWCYKHSAVPIGIESAPDGVLSFRAEVQDDQLIYGTERSEWSNGPNSCDKYRAVEGDETWTRSSIYLDENFPAYSSWSLIQQWKVPFEGTPPSQIALQNEDFAIRGVGSESPRKYLSIGPIARNQRINFDVGHYWHSDPSEGWVEVWRDGVQVLPRTTLKTLEESDDEVFLSIGHYRSSSNSGTAILWAGSTQITPTNPNQQ